MQAPTISSRLPLGKFQGDIQEYLSADTVHKEPGADDLNAHYPSEVLASLNGSGLPLSKLQIKVGAPVMLLRNLDPRHGLCNGTRAVIVKTTQRVIQVRVLTGDHQGELALIPRITLESSPEDFPFVLKRRQFPLRLAFAMTINKSQGQSLSTVGLDFRSPVFTHGQLYVALSRCTSSSRIKAIFPPNSSHTKTVNVVYPEVLIR